MKIFRNRDYEIWRHVFDFSSVLSIFASWSSFPCSQNWPSTLRVHDEGLKVWVELRHERVHKVPDGGPSLQHACHTHTHTNTGIRGCLQAARSGTRISLLFSITASHFIHAFLSAEIFLIWCQRSDHKKGKEKPFVFWDPLKQVLHFFFPN